MKMITLILAEQIEGMAVAYTGVEQKIYEANSTEEVDFGLYTTFVNQIIVLYASMCMYN